jgi:hypothetical protein
MKTAWTLLTLIFCGAALIYLGGGSAGVDVRRAVPWFGGFAPSWWDFAALALIVFTVLRIGRMVRGPHTSHEEEPPEDAGAEETEDEASNEDTGTGDGGAGTDDGADASDEA